MPDGPMRCAQSLSLEQFRDDVVDAVRGADVVDGDDIGMIQRGDGSRLLLEAAKPIRIRGEGGGEDLEGYVAEEASVARAVNLAHPAGTDERNDLVGTELRLRSEGHWCAGLYSLCGRLQALAKSHRIGTKMKAVGRGRRGAEESVEEGEKRQLFGFAQGEQLAHSKAARGSGARLAGPRADAAPANEQRQCG